MPTGTTCFIENDPNATFRQFALRCSRLFIYDSPMGNEPLPRREVQPYYVDELKKSRARLAELETMTVAQADVIAASEFVAAMKRHE